GGQEQRRTRPASQISLESNQLSAFSQQTKVPPQGGIFDLRDHPSFAEITGSRRICAIPSAQRERSAPLLLQILAMFGNPGSPASPVLTCWGGSRGPRQVRF